MTYPGKRVGAFPPLDRCTPCPARQTADRQAEKNNVFKFNKKEFGLENQIRTLQDRKAILQKSYAG